ncbi:transaldolase [Devosia naphthalenivorans]|uniref:transaldolase n=1 Tax=Devosia naphthalenivorans TaxID=2082392 RepID=UPI000D332FFE|nr:transaldolase [Devosia naphthalenivorans]
MASKLAQLRTMTTVVADTGDLDAVRHHRPMDCTTNPTIVLKAISGAGFEDRLAEAIRWGGGQTGSSQTVAAAVADRLAVRVGAALAHEVPGRVSTEVDADLSFDVEKSVSSGRRIIADYDRLGIDRKRILIKLAATWEGIRAAEILQGEGIDCNLTLVFSLAQAIACADAGVFLISPFVGRIMDWHAARTGQTYAPDEDPGVISVRAIYDYYKSNGIKTVVMGASFRNIGEIEALAGCDRLTIAPALLEKLDADTGHLEQRLSADRANRVELIALNEARFRWALNADAMATEKLSEGIRQFANDLHALRQLVHQRLAN